MAPPEIVEQDGEALESLSDRGGSAAQDEDEDIWARWRQPRPPGPNWPVELLPIIDHLTDVVHGERPWLTREQARALLDHYAEVWGHDWTWRDDHLIEHMREDAWKRIGPEIVERVRIPGFCDYVILVEHEPPHEIDPCPPEPAFGRFDLIGEDESAEDEGITLE